MKTLEEKAAYYRLSLQLGTHVVADVVSWADSEIASLAEPPVELIELALMQSANPLDVMSKLAAIAGGLGPLEVIDAVLGTAHKLLKTNPEFGPALARGLYQLYVECCHDVPDRLSPIAGFDDEYALANQGTYGSVEEVYRRLLEFTAKFMEAH